MVLVVLLSQHTGAIKLKEHRKTVKGLRYKAESVCCTGHRARSPPEPRKCSTAREDNGTLQDHAMKQNLPICHVACSVALQVCGTTWLLRSAQSRLAMLQPCCVRPIVLLLSQHSKGARDWEFSSQSDRSKRP